MKNTVSVCLSIHNQENIIEQILFGILNNMSDNVKELIIVLDGCIDATESKVISILKTLKIPNKIFYADNVWETKANNITFKNATCDYILTLQDDMLIQEKDFDKRLMNPFEVVDNVLGTTARNASNEYPAGERIQYYDVAGKDVNTPRNLFCIRQVIVRGPMMLNHDKLKILNYLDEDFAPITCDEKDLCFRAYRKGWIVGAYAMEYSSPLIWGKIHNHNAENQAIFQDSARKNEKLIIDRHLDLMKETHNKEIVIA